MFDAARQAYRREQEIERIGGYQFGFPAYLSTEMGDVEPTLALTTAWEAIKAVHEIAAHRDSGADFEQYIDCAIAACTCTRARDGVAGTGALSRLLRPPPFSLVRQ